MMPLESVVAEIRSGAKVANARLVELLSSPLRQARFLACIELARAFAGAGHRETALRMSRRAFGLWDGEPGFIDDHLALLRADGDAEGIRAAGKRAGMLSVGQRDVMSAVRYFNIHHYAYQSTGRGDRYEYDHDILRAIERLAGVGAEGRLPQRPAVPGNKIRVAYLVYGANHTKSVLVRLMLDFASHHDRDQFEVLFFSPDIDIPARQANADLLHSAGGKLITANSPDDRICLAETATAVDRFAPDFLVSVAALADYRQYYLFARCPAAVRVSLSYGPPAQFVPPTTDWVITASIHTLIDSPQDGSLIQIEATPPVPPQGAGSLPEGVYIPEGAVVIMAAGRSEKFLSRQYWEAILDVLEAFPNACFIAFGLIVRPDFLDELQATAPGRRVQVLGWLEDYHDLLARADIVVDTYPSGGGLTVMDSMVFGIPVLAFANDYLNPFDQTNWNPAEEILCNPELVVPRDDFKVFSRRLSDLISDPVLRKRLGEECRRHVNETRGNPQRMVRRVESEYLRLWEQACVRRRLEWIETPRNWGRRLLTAGRQSIRDWRMRRAWRKFKQQAKDR